ncbi:MAG: hypothetical protein ACREIT_04100 [Tepidisphaeraceae bacterium]
MTRRHHRVCTFVTLLGTGLLCMLVVAPALAQNGGISREMKEGTVPINAGVINQFITTQVQGLSSDNPQVQKSAREALVDETGGTAAPPAAGFMEAYSAALNQAIGSALKNPAMRTRLNAGITVAKVAERAKNAKLIDATLTLLADDAQPVVLWGMKASRWVLPSVVANPAAVPNGAKLIPAILSAAKKYPTGPITQEAYDALMMDLANARAQLDPLPVVLPAILDLFGARVKQYVGGVPEEPKTDNKVTLFLTAWHIWNAMTPEQRAQAMQTMSDLLWVSSQRLASLQRDQRGALIDTMKSTASAVKVVGNDILGDANLTAAAAAADRAMIEATRNEEITKVTANLLAAIRKNPAFNGIKDPPEIEPNSATNGAPK